MKSLFCCASNYHHQEALIYAALIFQLLPLNVAASIDPHDRVLSFLNFSKDIAKAIVNWLAELAFTFDSRHILIEKRARKSLMDQILTY